MLTLLLSLLLLLFLFLLCSVWLPRIAEDGTEEGRQDWGEDDLRGMVALHAHASPPSPPPTSCSLHFGIFVAPLYSICHLPTLK